jgi:hypothetical protein
MRIYRAQWWLVRDIKSTNHHLGTLEVVLGEAEPETPEMKGSEILISSVLIISRRTEVSTLDVMEMGARDIT